MSRALRQTYVIGDRACEAELHLEDGRLAGRLVEGEEATAIEAAVARVDAHRIRLEVDGRRVRATVLRDGDVAWVCIGGHTYEVTVAEPGAGAAHHAGEEDFAVSPMTGVVAKVAVAPGDAVEPGAELFVVEAMKMEYVVKAPRAVTIAEVNHGAGDAVDQGRVVVTFVGSGA